jgi:hypothetical protein
MRIIEDDGSFITFEQLEPKWTIAEVVQKHHNRIAQELTAVGITPVWESDWEDCELDPRVSGARGTYRKLKHEFVQRHWHRLDKAALERISIEHSGDYREANGLRRHDGKPVERVARRMEYEKLADMFEIPTNDTATGPWRRLVREAVLAAEPRGRIGEDDD